MPRALDADFVGRFARGPSTTTTSTVISAHTSIRKLLGDTDYATLLQGSYKNDTALWDINDVDIVAVSTNLRSRAHSGWPGNGGPGTTWHEIFAKIEQKLESSALYKGKWERKDKCIQVNTTMKVDIVPAVFVESATSDPVSVYSFRAATERLNWPREHYEKGAAKSGATYGAYKPTVRLFKRWSKCWFTAESKVAPSYYVECLVHSRPNSEFSGDLAADFTRIAEGLVGINYSTQQLPRIAGAGNLFTEAEWTQGRFEQFQQRLRQALPSLRAALSETSQARARQHWIDAFNGDNGV